jgi:hypothetical protein
MLTGRCLLVHIVDAEGINALLPQLRSEVGIDILIQEESYLDCAVFPWRYASSSRRISSSISVR